MTRNDPSAVVPQFTKSNNKMTLMCVVLFDSSSLIDLSPLTLKYIYIFFFFIISDLIEMFIGRHFWDQVPYFFFNCISCFFALSRT